MATDKERQVYADARERGLSHADAEAEAWPPSKDDKTVAAINSLRNVIILIALIVLFMIMYVVQRSNV